MIDIDTYSIIGAKLWANREEPSGFFVNQFINHRPKVVAEILKAHPNFSSVAQMMNYSEGDDILGKMIEEFNSMFEWFKNDMSFKNDIYFLILLAAQGATIYRNNPADQATLIALVENINQLNIEIVGMSSIILLVAALWFSNYDDYRNRVYQKENELRRQGFYD